MSNDSAAERWLPIPGYEGRYEVSDQGRVRSLPRISPSSGGRTQRIRGALLKPFPGSRSGHLSVDLCTNGSRVARRVHRLVLETFVGPAPDGLEGCHGNGDPTDNRLVNLRWDTHSANMHDKVRHGRCHRRNTTHCPWGHPLVAPNLVLSEQKKGHRECLACARARAAIHLARKKGLSLDMQVESDSRYAAIKESEALANGST